MKKLFVALASLLLLQPVTHAQNPAKPKLVIGIVVDQMRWDYLYKYSARYGNDGFKRMLSQGFSCENTFIPYTPTYTAAGHTSVYTGSVPAVDGIVGNNWYRRDLKRSWYCAEDTSVRSVGSTSAAGKMSPRNMAVTTITDEVRLANNFQSKVVGIALKDRGAILPAGHSANAAYWFDNSTGGWISSTYYMQELPGWVKAVNARKLPDQYLAADWKPLYPISSYTLSTADDKPYESRIGGEDNAFPHETSKITTNKYESFRQTPGGNTFTFDMAKAAVEGEKMGQRGVMDFLTVSLSSTDYIGHAFGPNSIEVEDCYLRLDRDLGEFFKYLDAKVGAGQYLVFLTADHGAAHVPGFLKEHNIPAGAIDDAVIFRWINEQGKLKFGLDRIVASVMNYQLYLDFAILDSAKIDREGYSRWAVEQLKQHPAIMDAVDLHHLGEAAMPDKIKTRLVNGYNQKLSGDLQFVFMPGWFDGSDKGTTHGTWSPYDAHIPLVWFGWKIKKGATNRETYMTDISATVAALLHVQMPNGCVGDVIEEVTK